MRADRIFFAPGPLAIGKGFAYLLAFCTALVVINPTEQAFYYGIIVYCCGCICDYVEASMKSTGKCPTIRIISLLITVLMGIIVILAFSLLSRFDSLTEYIYIIAGHKFLVSLFFSVFWTLPLGCGIILCIPQKERKDSPRPPGKYTLGYYIMPRAD